MLNPDGIIFVGDLGEGDLRLVKSIKSLPFPTAVILGNHDRGFDGTGEILKKQISILGDSYCGWSKCDWGLKDISVIGARPCSSGGGFYLSPEVRGAFGEVSLTESVELISDAASLASEKHPLLLLAHSGPSGLGSEADSPCGRDWKSPAIDWGDKDLQLAIDKIRKNRIPDIVVFGHTHHSLRGGSRYRKTFSKDSYGTVYLNAAYVPRKGISVEGEQLYHFSWIIFDSGVLTHVSHRWFQKDATLAYQELLLDKNMQGN